MLWGKREPLTVRNGLTGNCGGWEPKKEEHHPQFLTSLSAKDLSVTVVSKCLLSADISGIKMQTVAELVTFSIRMKWLRAKMEELQCRGSSACSTVAHKKTAVNILSPSKTEARLIMCLCVSIGIHHMSACLKSIRYLHKTVNKSVQFYLNEP